MTEFKIINIKIKLYSLRTYLLSILDDDRLTEDKRNEYINLCDNLQSFSELATFYELEIKSLKDINLELCKQNLDIITKCSTLAEENKHLKANL